MYACLVPTLLVGLLVAPPDRPADYQENFNVRATFGEDLLHAVLAAKDTVCVPHDKLQLQGFEVDQFTSHRWPHVKLTGSQGALWAAVPGGGRYHVGFMMYDDANDERVGLFVDGKFCGVAAARQDNNRTWLYWLAEPRTFRGGERVELRALGGRGKFGIINLLFLPQTPEVRQVRFAVQNLVSASDARQPGRTIVSWTTTWPCPTRFEYGPDAKYGKTAASKNSCLVHRVVLERLDPAVTYHGRAVGAARDGTPFASDDFAFRAGRGAGCQPAENPANRQPAGNTADWQSAPHRRATTAVPLAVRNPHPFAVDGWPITTGVPCAQGMLASAERVRLRVGNKDVPAQVRVTARWPDGSVKWLLVSFLAAAPASGASEYRLEFGRDVQPARPPAGLSVTEGADGVRIDTGPLALSIDRRGNLASLKAVLVAPTCPATTLAEDIQGNRYAPGKGELQIEEAGPIRAVVKTVAPLVDEKGARLLRIEQRIEVYRGSPLVRIHHTLVVDGEEKFTRIHRLALRVGVPSSAGPWQVPLADGRTLSLDRARAGVCQRFDDQLAVASGGPAATQTGRIVGSLIGGPRGCAVAVRDFWQNYPKGFRVQPDGLYVDLCPEFEAGLYDKFPFEREGHHLYYYLVDGCYRLKRGMAKTHELLLCFAPPGGHALGNGPLCTLFQRPLVATAPAEWYCRSKAFYDVAPRNLAHFKQYEDAIDANLKAYPKARERQHDYGMINYGDWYGERGTNWGNVEYDTQHAFFLEYIRSGNPEALFLGEATELHHRDVDTVHAAADPRQLGGVYIHVMGHVGDYYDKPVPGSLGFPHGGFSVSHAWTEGHFDHYFLTGDPRSYETGCAVADFFIRQELGRPYDFLNCRTPGWHLIMLASAYHATGDPYYLNAARVVVERVLETQDKRPRPLPDYQAAGRKPFQVGGWSRMMVPGHCECEPRHRGNAGFMVAVLLSGLKYYHDVTGDPRVKEAIIRGAHYLLDETYSDEVRGFRYTSCPKTGYHPGASPLMVEGIARAYLWTRDARFRRVLTESLPLGGRGSAYGKGFSMYYRMAPRLLADLEAAGLRLDAPAGK